MRWIFILALIAPLSAFADNTMDPKRDYRYCGPPPRDVLGHIIRDRSVYWAFRKLNPCPATKQVYGACPGWQVDHDWPLAKGGCDAVYNMTWMRVEIKTCAQDWCKDRYEMHIFTVPEPSTEIPAN